MCQVLSTHSSMTKKEKSIPRGRGNCCRELPLFHGLDCMLEEHIELIQNIGRHRTRKCPRPTGNILLPDEKARRSSANPCGRRCHVIEHGFRFAQPSTALNETQLTHRRKQGLHMTPL